MSDKEDRCPFSGRVCDDECPVSGVTGCAVKEMAFSADEISQQLDSITVAINNLTRIVSQFQIHD